jgi:hypothetical protein
MSLYLPKKIYVDTYHTNWAYLDNMTELQMKALKGINWNKGYESIHTGLEYFPWAWDMEGEAKATTISFIGTLKRTITEL